MTHRHTYTFLSERFAAAGLRPLTRYGQNFLIDLNLVDLIARTAELQPCDVVLEIGTGTGSLTSRLCEQAGWVVTVEVDEGLYQLSGEELKSYPNVTRIQQDALRNKNHLAEVVLDAVQEARQKIPERRFKLVANLPYNIATPILSNLLALEDPPDFMVATIQKELADRIIAPPSTRDYSALSIWIQSQCQASIVRTLPPTVFWPQPKVTSAILRIARDTTLASRITDRPFFHKTVRSLFVHRRKYLRAVVVHAMSDRLDKAQVDHVLADGGFDPTNRVEQLAVSRMIDLVDQLRRAVERTHGS